jgi:hypothetical protein
MPVKLGLYRRLNRWDMWEKVAQNRHKNTGNELRKADQAWESS